MRQVLPRLSLVLCLATTSSCGKDPDSGKQASNEKPPEESGPVTLGAVFNLSGAQAGIDVPSSRGARLAVEEINQEGGVLGRKVDLVIVNGRTDPAVIAAKTEELIEEHPTLSALLGLSDTDMVLAAAPVAARARRVFVTSGATSPKLSAQIPDFLYLACFGDNVQAAAGAEWAYDELSARTVSVLFNSTETYTRLLHVYFETRFIQLGGQVLSASSYTSLEDLPQAIESTRKADLIYLASRPDESARAVRMLREAGFDVPILGGDGFDSEGLWGEYPELVSVFFTTHVYLGEENPRPLVQAFRRKYAEMYPKSRPNAFAALGYDAVQLIMAAITRAGSADPTAVYNAMGEIQGFEGVTGKISYSDGRRIPVKSVSVVEIEGGDVRLRRELTPKQVPPPRFFGARRIENLHDIFIGIFIIGIVLRVID